MECCKASQFSNDAGAHIWQAADVGYLALRYGAWLTWACLTLQLSSHLVPLLLQESSHLVPLLLQESSLHFLSFLLKLFWFIIIIINVSAKLSSAAKPGLNKNAYISIEDKSAESAITERT